MILPRGLVFIVTIWIFAAWWICIGIRPPIQPTIASYLPGIRIFFAAISIGLCVAWPMLRLSERPAPAPIRQVMIDFISIVALRCNRNTAIHAVNAARVIAMVDRHAIESGFEPPPKVSRSTPMIGPSSQPGGGGQSIRAQKKCAIGPINEIKTMAIMQKSRSSDERLPMDFAKIAAMIAPHEKRKRSINPMRCCIW